MPIAAALEPVAAPSLMNDFPSDSICFSDLMPCPCNDCTTCTAVPMPTGNSRANPFVVFDSLSKLVPVSLLVASIFDNCT